jgi:hypothetical protein
MTSRYCFDLALHDVGVDSGYIKAGLNSLVLTMSLPPAPKDISTHPTKGSVVDPVNKANKDADVDRKVLFLPISIC